MRTEIENILEGLPYNFLIEDADESYADIIFLGERDIILLEGIIVRNGYIYRNKEFYLVSYGFSCIENETIFIEILPIENIKQIFENKLSAIKNTLDHVIRLSKE